MKDYPVLDVLDDVKSALVANPVVILQAPPGAGKSTVLPLKLYRESWLAEKKIIMLEPRRLAARSVSARMASLLDEDIGHTIGYRIRFESRVSRHTRIEVVTEGILTRMIQSDNALETAGLIILDEFHERSLAADLALSLCLQVQQILRPDLRILIMSATLDGIQLSKTLDNAPLINCEGRQYPIRTLYEDQPGDDPVPVNVARGISKALREQQGDILAFLPGAWEINKTLELLRDKSPGSVICPLYGDLSFDLQQKAILPDAEGRRKIVLATSIAETSLTIEGVTVVVDSGFSRVPRYDPRSGLTKLETVRVTADAADQRAGRAGRVGPGVCYRLWNARTDAFLQPHRKPEILEADLSSLLLELAAWGAADVQSMKWITVPPAGAVSQARQLLTELEALRDGKITDKGKEMVKLPTHPRLAHMMLHAKADHGRLSLACDCAALLEERDPMPAGTGADLTLRVELLARHRSRKTDAGNTLLDRIARSADNWRRIMRVTDRASSDPSALGELLAAAYPDRIAQQQHKHGERYKLANGRMARLPAHDPLVHEPWIVAAHLDGGGGEGRIFLAAPIGKDELLSYARQENRVIWDDVLERVTAYAEQRIGALVVGQKKLTTIPDDDRVAVVLRLIRERGLKAMKWENEQIQWQARMLSVRSWQPGEDWPDVSDETLLNNLDDWLTPYLKDVVRKEDIKRIDPAAIISSGLSWEQQKKLDRLAPRHIRVPSGSMITVNYFADGRTPFIEVRLQEVFGWQQIPAVNDGQVPLLLHLLSPGYRAVQVTQDLGSFWKNVYPEVRKELQRRYPKHAWPEDPLTATAVRGAKRRNTPSA